MLDPFLLRAILENPHDDSLRLIVADHLDEHGHQDRADLIRTQVQLADQPTVALRQHERQLFKRLRKTLVFPFPCDVGIEPIQTGRLPRPLVVWRRGFGDSVHCTREEWQWLWPKIAAREPVQSVRLWGMSPNVANHPRYYGLRYSWHFVSRPRHAFELPMKWRPGSDEHAWIADSDFVAYEWLSNLAVNWARREAGLGELEDNSES